MPQNIVVGDEAEAVADFVAEYAGGEIDRPVNPGDSSEEASVAEQDAAEATPESEPPAGGS